MNDEPVVDYSRSVEIGDWLAAVVVYADGAEWLWLLSLGAAGTPGCACPGCAPHDQLDVQTHADESA